MPQRLSLHIEERRSNNNKNKPLLFEMPKMPWDIDDDDGAPLKPKQQSLLSGNGGLTITTTRRRRHELLNFQLSNQIVI